ncbi:MAG: mobile mystery protein A [Burkholderiales bacterium]|nr:mobile mystery protein A [Burkholderiales bacterium]
MPKTLSSLQLSQVDQRLAPWRRMANDVPPRGGWLRAIRKALGMSAAQLAGRLGVAQQAIVNFERNEAAGKITLQSLQRVAQALDCRVVYAVVPNKPLVQMRRARAQALADQLVRPVAHSMKLEAQGVSDKETRRQRKELTDEILRGSARKLWR